MFFRQEFVIDDINSLRGLWLNVWCDDGLGIWINGQPPRSPILMGGLVYTDTATGSPRWIGFMRGQENHLKSLPKGDPA